MKHYNRYQIMALCNNGISKNVVSKSTDCSNEINSESWMKLHELIYSNRDQFNTIIINDGGPQKMEKAKRALMNLIDSLNIHINHVHKKAA